MLTLDSTATTRWREQRRFIAEASEADRTDALEAQARRIRRSVLTMIGRAGQGHVGGDLSVTDILTVLFWEAMCFDPEQPRRGDRFILSKGHCTASLYSVLAEVGYFAETELPTFFGTLSSLGGHPDRNKVPGVETNTGPLGHGLPVAVGIAIGQRLRGEDARVYVVTGDGEMQEGSNWEALMTANQRQLHNLTVIVDRNRLQQGASTEDTNTLEPLPERLRSFGFETRDVDGHDVVALADALKPSSTGRPVAVIANTTKGRGVSFMEGRVEWHHKVPTAEQVTEALKELAS